MENPLTIKPGEKLPPTNIHPHCLCLHYATSFPIDDSPMLNPRQRHGQSVFTTVPGAAANVSAATLRSGATRCTRALTVVQRMRGFYSEPPERASRDSAVMRRAVTAALGDTRS